MSMKLSEKDLVIHIISQDNEYDRTIRLTPWGIEGSSKLVTMKKEVKHILEVMNILMM